MSTLTERRSPFARASTQRGNTEARWVSDSQTSAACPASCGAYIGHMASRVTGRHMREITCSRLNIVLCCCLLLQCRVTCVFFNCFQCNRQYVVYYCFYFAINMLALRGNSTQLFSFPKGGDSNLQSLQPRSSYETSVSRVVKPHFY